MHTDEQKIEFIERFLSQYGRGRWADKNNVEPLETLLSMMKDDVDWWIAGIPDGGHMTKEKFRRALLLLDGVTDSPLVITPDAWTIQGNRLAVEAHSEMKLKTGITYRNKYHFLFVLDGDRIAVYHEYHDTAHTNDTFLAGVDLSGSDSAIQTR